MAGPVLEFDRPCCNSRRTCRDTFHAIISLRTGQILRKIRAVRCYRLGFASVKYRFYPSDDVILVAYYETTRQNVRLQVLWKPESVTEEFAYNFALLVLKPELVSLEEEEVVE